MWVCVMGYKSRLQGSKIACFQPVGWGWQQRLTLFSSSNKIDGSVTFNDFWNSNRETRWKKSKSCGRGWPGTICGSQTGKPDGRSPKTVMEADQGPKWHNWQGTKKLVEISNSYGLIEDYQATKVGCSLFSLPSSLWGWSKLLYSFLQCRL